VGLEVRALFPSLSPYMLKANLSRAQSSVCSKLHSIGIMLASIGHTTQGRHRAHTGSSECMPAFSGVTGFAEACAMLLSKVPMNLVDHLILTM
jgi:hypothetical protein